MEIGINAQNMAVLKLNILHGALKHAIFIDISACGTHIKFLLLYCDNGVK